MLRQIKTSFNDWQWIRHRYHQCLKIYKKPERQMVINEHPLTVEQKKEIDDFFLANYGQKIPYICHQYYSALSGVFNVRYFPDILFYTYFERYMNPNLEYNKVLQDKNILPYIAESVGVLMPKTIVSYTQGVYRDGNGNVVDYQKVVDILRDNGNLFCKPSRSSCGGKGCFCSDFSQKEVDINASLKSLGSEFVIQEMVNCDPSIKAVYPYSVNTFRVITYRWKDDFYFMPAAMRIGHGGAVVDNASSGGMFVSISDEGVLRGSAVTYSKKFSEHPDTHLVFDGHQINNFVKVREAAMRMHTALPQIGVVGWDFTLNENGQPLLIEANIGFVSIVLCQMPFGIPAFGDRTAEVLQWIRKMKHIPYNKRGDYVYGN